MLADSYRISTRAILSAVLMTSAGLTAAEPVKAAGALFSPSSVPSLGKLTLAAGATVTFDTGSATTEPAVSGPVTGKGSLGQSSSGKVQVALFAFDSIALGDGAKVVVTGDRGLVLLSKAGIAVDTIISVSGADGAAWGTNAPPVDADGGPGGEGGTYGKDLASSPPPADGGNGSAPMKDNGRPGRGFGGGFNERVKGAASGGGGAYGGKGGDSSEGSGGNGNPPRVLPGGTAYGDPALVDLFGGSGGGGASNDRGSDLGSGGGGGGAIALIALTEITFGAKGGLLATGGRGARQRAGGGGGSGGAILVGAPIVTFAPGSVIDARGGEGATGILHVAAGVLSGKGRRHAGSGGGGSGGRVAIYTKADLGKPGKNQAEPLVPETLPIVIDGGDGGYMAKEGQTGTWYDGTWAGVK